MAVGHRKNLMTNIAQHKPKNTRSKEDDKQIYSAMLQVSEYIKNRFDFEKSFPSYDIVFEKEISVQYIIDFIRSHRVRTEFDLNYVDRKIIPDGGILFLVKTEDGEETQAYPYF